MPFELRPARPNSAGVLIFTHKERGLFDRPAKPLARALEALRRRYVVGIHWGHYATDVPAIPWADFHLAGAGTLAFAPGVDALHIPFGSRNFTPSAFRDLGIHRYWDVLTVARPLALKNLDQLMRAVRLLYDSGRHLRVLMICPAPERMSGRGWYRQIYQDYRDWFTPGERERFTLLLIRDGNPFPLGQDAMVWLYSSSKVFALLSEQEGESRVVAEALLCGCQVVVRSDIRGGADDYLTPENSARFDSVSALAEALHELAGSFRERQFDPAALRAELSEEYTASRLREVLVAHFGGRGLVADEDWDLTDLARKLPSHDITLPPAMRLETTNDLRSPVAALAYIQELVGEPRQSRTDFGRVHLVDVTRRARRRATLVVNPIRFRIGAIALRVLPGSLARRLVRNSQAP